MAPPPLATADSPPEPTRGVPRRAFLGWMAFSAGCLIPASSLAAAPAAPEFLFDAPLIPAPDDPARWPAFREALQRWRQTTRTRLGYEATLYERAEFGWTARCFCCGFLMACDETFYDHRAAEYRVANFVEHGQREFGGYDAVVLWQAYPRIGVDARNQFDYYRDLPGGLLGVRDVTRQFQARGVRVFLDYNPWDTGTRREPRSDLETLATLVQVLEADGIFLDTMDRGAEAFRAQLDSARPGVALEGEIALPLERVYDHHLSWAQWFADSHAPGVLRNKWLERRHLQHQIRRWDRDHTAELHTAWMNGSGMLVWENVFGSWMGWSPRDRSILRAMLPIQRRYAPLFTGEDWTPLVPTRHRDVFASLWQGPGLRLWTLVNRSEAAIEGDLLAYAPDPARRGDAFDLVQGEAAIRDHPASERVVWVGQLGPRGVGCLVEGTPDGLGPGLREFVHRQRALHARASVATLAEPRPTQLHLPHATRKRRRPLKGMVEVPAAEMVFRTEMRVRECGFYESVPAAGHRLGDSYRVQVERFERPVRLLRFAIDRTPVTNRDFAAFLAKSGYRPRHPENFLKHWGHGHPPAGQEMHPVVYVHLEDARAYAAWAGKRLPTEEEWQYAAGGPEQRRYPWGDTFRPDCCNDGSHGEGTTAVTRFPEGASPFGVLDLCGNVWEWTESERSDGRTRFCLLKGGSHYGARGSGWYFDGGPQANGYAAKFLLMGPGLDRCATVGFRCVQDLR